MSRSILRSEQTSFHGNIATMVESQIQHSTSERVDYLPGVYDYFLTTKILFCLLVSDPATLQATPFKTRYVSIQSRLAIQVEMK